MRAFTLFVNFDQHLIIRKNDHLWELKDVAMYLTINCPFQFIQNCIISRIKTRTRKNEKSIKNTVSKNFIAKLLTRKIGHADTAGIQNCKENARKILLENSEQF